MENNDSSSSSSNTPTPPTTEAPQQPPALPTLSVTVNVTAQGGLESAEAMAHAVVKATKILIPNAQIG